MSMKGNYKKVLSLPKRLLPITPRANTTLMGQICLYQSSRLPPRTRPRKRAGKEPASHPSGSPTESNMALGLISLVSRPAKSLFGMRRCGSQLRINRSYSATADWGGTAQSAGTQPAWLDFERIHTGRSLGSQKKKANDQ